MESIEATAQPQQLTKRERPLSPTITIHSTSPNYHHDQVQKKMKVPEDILEEEQMERESLCTASTPHLPVFNFGYGK
jgi:hypothetical protein